LETSKAKQDLLFVNKKKQKNFDSLKHLALTVANPAGIRSFCFFFSKKKRLLAFPNSLLERDIVALPHLQMKGGVPFRTPPFRHQTGADKIHC
jgi:hypothetical protein